MKPKVLILSRDSWNETNSSGNTLSNYFKNWDSESIANIYCRDEIPDNNICVNYFKISESVLINKLLRRTKNAGIKITKNNDLFQIDDLKREESEKKIYNFFRKNRWIVFLWAREIIWKLVNWRSKDLNQFLTDFEPEIIFSFSYDSFFMHDILYYIQFRTKAKVVLFHCDDLVTFRQYSYSPLFWINRILLRIKMNKSIKLANQNYCIIDEQLRIYKSIYNLDFKLLYKTGQFISMPNSKKQSLPLKFVYTGNIICGRIKSLIEIAKVLKRINQNEIKVVLYIYTANVISSEDYNVLINNDFVKIMGKVTYDEIPKILSDSDVLINV